MAAVVRYQVDDDTTVGFEIDAPQGFADAGIDQLKGRIHDAIAPAVAGAKVVIDKVRELGPDEVEVTFGIKVSGTFDWLIAKAASEANFQVTLTWRPTDAATAAEAPPTAVDAGPSTSDDG